MQSWSFSLLIINLLNFPFTVRNLYRLTRSPPLNPTDVLLREEPLKGLVIITNRDCNDALFSGVLYTDRLIVCCAIDVYQRDAGTLDALVGLFHQQFSTRYQLISKYIHRDYQAHLPGISQIAVLKVSYTNLESYEIYHRDLILYWIATGQCNVLIGKLYLFRQQDPLN